MRTHVVGQHKGVPALVMFEPVIDTFVFHQAADEIKIGFVLLHAVRRLAIMLNKPQIQRKTIFTQHFAQDVFDAFDLENSIITGLRGIP